VLPDGVAFQGMETAKGNMMLVFTDHDLAERFVRRVGRDNIALVCVEDVPTFCRVLELAMAKDFVIVGGDVDGVEGHGVKWYRRIDDMLKGLRDEDDET